MKPIKRRINMIFEVDEWGPSRVPVDMSWHPSDPFAVRADFKTKGGPVWTFGRDLLHAGLIDTSGEGDVQIGPDPEEPHTELQLRLVDAHTGRTATFRMSRAALVEFLFSTSDAVPFGEEVIEWDTELASLLDAA